ncbi:uncharacterized protein LOC111671282 [Seriola lalandi dorsalis]|uniref:uncharacterized protein LOC111671282 n=1 Tax=Seriola lalandi dorsalis TaxID=1841481 RepID=UPI000C6F8224|nr:uncharacterized protein LOC111671282 [Seriola lalandi dorsalis]XP_056229301.1 uncharacterized protein LOC130167311 [Seriola aureovittata]
MATKNFCPQIRRRKLDVRKTEREEDEEKDIDCSQPVSRCPACNRGYDVALILPCSHTMCGHCVAAGEKTSSGQSLLRGVSLSVCSVLCPCCRHPVELPCWTWSAATSCLPEHPTLSHSLVNSRETGIKTGASEGHPQDMQSDTRCRDETEERAQSCLPGSTAASSPITPVDGVVDLQEAEMEQSVFGLCFAMDPSTVPPSLHLSNASLTVTYRGPPTPPPDNKFRRSKMTPDSRVVSALPQVCADVVIAQGQYYWEVDVCNSSVYRIGVISLDGAGGWWLERQGLSFCAVYDGSREPLRTVPPQIKSLGVFLNIGGGTLSFHNPLTQEHLATLPTRFSSAGLLPALGLGQGRLRLRCRLPPPPHVFLSKDSVYRGPCGAGGAPWRREIPFQSVRKVIQKFEELAVSDSDSGLVSSFGSSCSTLASLPDLGIPGMFPSGHAGQETGAE